MAIIRGTNGDNVREGGSFSDSIYGYGGDDILIGNGGNDYISGGSGDDDIIGGSGENDLRGGTGFDYFIVSPRSGANSSDDLILDFTFDDDAIDVSDWGASDFSQIRALLRTDSDGDATLNAFYDDRDHRITVADVSTSELQSSDFVFSNAGAKSIYGTNNQDVLFGSREGDIIRGYGEDDILLGGGGNDTLSGGSGDDDLHGGSGRDTMTGGTGEDIFAFASTSESRVGSSSRDRILDFLEDVDLIDVSDIDAEIGPSGNQSFEWIGGDSYDDRGQLRYYYSDGDTVIAGNTDSDSSSEFQVELEGIYKLVGDDFIL